MIALLRLRPYTGDALTRSPNRGMRRALAIQGIVLHATADDGDEAGTLSWMRSPKSGVSCHLLVSRTGRVTRLVGDQQRAWHAGVAWWRGTNDVNSVTLGIEIANRNDGEPYTEAQYRRVAAIVAHYCRQGLSLDDVVSHAEVAEGRRTDPLGWDWDRFRALVLEQLRPRSAPAPIPAPAPTPTPALPPPLAPELDGMVAAATPVVEQRSVDAPKQSAVVIGTPKLALYSRTLWVNAFMVVTAGGMLAGDTLDLAHRVGITVPEELTKWALFVIGLVNIILRLRTKRPLTCRTSGECQPDVPPLERVEARRLDAPPVVAPEAREPRRRVVGASVASMRVRRGAMSRLG